MSEDEEVKEKVLEATGSLNRLMNIGTGLIITAIVIYLLSMTDNPLHPANNPGFGAFLTVLGLAGLYWLVTGIKPGLKISNLFD